MPMTISVVCRYCQWASSVIVSGFNQDGSMTFECPRCQHIQDDEMWNFRGMAKPRTNLKFP